MYITFPSLPPHFRILFVSPWGFSFFFFLTLPAPSAPILHFFVFLREISCQTLTRSFALAFPQNLSVESKIRKKDFLSVLNAKLLLLMFFSNILSTSFLQRTRVMNINNRINMEKKKLTNEHFCLSKFLIFLFMNSNMILTAKSKDLRFDVFPVTKV